MPSDFGIGKAVKEMRKGESVSRRGWNGPNQFIAMKDPDEESDMTMPYLYIRPTQGGLVPWLASQTDILATDWFVWDCNE